MIRLLLLALLLVATNAVAAITFIGSSSSTNVAVTSRTIGEPAGTTENDVMIALCDIDTTDGTWSMTGWTKIDENDTAPSASSVDGAIFYIVRGASAPSTSCSYSGTAGRIYTHALTFRGVDTSTPFDVTYSNASHFSEPINGGNQACASITTNTDGAWVVCMSNIEGTNPYGGGYGPASGYTLAHDPSSDDAFDRIGTSQYKEVATAGAETPGVWTHDDTGGGNLAASDLSQYTLALKPAGAGGGVDYALYRRRGR